MGHGRPFSDLSTCAKNVAGGPGLQYRKSKFTRTITKIKL
jgi:hypothetical protein